MSFLTSGVVVNLALLILTLIVRAVTVNRLVVRKLLLTAVVTSAALVGSVLLAAGVLPADWLAQAASFNNLLLALGAINFAVITIINPLREDRVPARFPNIVQDAIVVGLFVAVATAVLQEKFLTTSAVGAVVVGFALQDTLGNAFAGLAIQTEKPYRAGQWIRVGGHEGRVDEITWRATRLRTKDGTYVIVPNNVMSKEAIVNISEPVLATRLVIDVGGPYSVPPNEVKAAILAAIRNVPQVLATPAPEALLFDFGHSAITYRARFWLEDWTKDEPTRSDVRTAIWYEFQRRNIDIPLPSLVHYPTDTVPTVSPVQAAGVIRALAGVEVFHELMDDDRAALAAMSRVLLFGTGDIVVRQGDAGSSMFVVASGHVDIVLEPEGRLVSTTGAGGFFGEMSMLTGDARSATVRAGEDCALVEVTADAFRRFVLEKPDVLHDIAGAVATRRAEIDRQRSQAAQSPAPGENALSLLSRVRRFLRIPD